MKIINNASLKNYTSYKLGGKAKKLFIVETLEDLLSLDESTLLNSEIIGEGTNVLVSDEGTTKPIIKIAVNGLEIASKRIKAMAGTNLSTMAIELVKKGYRDFMFAVGIPGTVGGAVVMNSGTDKSISNVLERVEIMGRDKERKTLSVNDMKYGYRSSVLQEMDCIVLSATFKADRSVPIDQEQVDRKLSGRARKQPLGFPSAGCWFKDAWGGSDIIREIGMAGKWEGGAVSSPLFPAFILNVDATAQDVYSLAKEIQSKAEAVGKSLPLEIKIIGEFR